MTTMDVFTLEITVRWADLDPNGHVRHSIYYDYGTHARISHLDQAGFGIAWMTRHGIGPVLFREEAHFFRELHLGDELLIDVRLAGLSEDRRKWSMRHRITRGAELCATLDLDGAWLDLQRRRLTAPPGELLETFEALPHTEDFRVIGAGGGH
jgi:acyl-CoA thioester hydrolase